MAVYQHREIRSGHIRAASSPARGDSSAHLFCDMMKWIRSAYQAVIHDHHGSMQTFIVASSFSSDRDARHHVGMNGKRKKKEEELKYL